MPSWLRRHHAHWAEVNPGRYPVGTAEFGVVPWNEAPPVVPARKTSLG